jgi:hypothetical protein
VKTGARQEDKGVTLDIGVTRDLLGGGRRRKGNISQRGARRVFFEHARS